MLKVTQASGKWYRDARVEAVALRSSLDLCTGESQISQGLGNRTGVFRGPWERSPVASSVLSYRFTL